MRRKTEVLLDMIVDALARGNRLHAHELAKQLRVSHATIHNGVRMLREMRNVGVHPAKDGYCLSEWATKQDDVHYLRRLLGALEHARKGMAAARPYIERRWTSLEQKRQLRLIVAPLSGGTRALDSGFRVLSSVNLKMGRRAKFRVVQSVGRKKKKRLL